MNQEAKKIIREILLMRDEGKLRQWASDTRAPLRQLFSLTYDSDSEILYLALEAIGKISVDIAEKDQERIRNFLRSLLWLMSEESGGIGWHAPEAIAEICLRIPGLSEEYARLLPQFVKEESFRQSTLAALHRLAPMLPNLMKECAAQVLSITGDNYEFFVYDFHKGHRSKSGVKQLFQHLENPARGD